MKTSWWYDNDFMMMVSWWCWGKMMFTLFCSLSTSSCILWRSKTKVKNIQYLPNNISTINFISRLTSWFFRSSSWEKVSSLILLFVRLWDLYKRRKGHLIWSKTMTINIDLKTNVENWPLSIDKSSLLFVKLGFQIFDSLLQPTNHLGRSRQSSFEVVCSQYLIARCCISMKFTTIQTKIRSRFPLLTTFLPCDRPS